MTGFATLLRGDPGAADAVPPGGSTGYLAALAAAVMALLAVFSLAAALTANRVAGTWSMALDGVATLEVPAAAAGDGPARDRALMILGQTPGIGGARALAPDEVRALLDPWLGGSDMLDDADLPLLIAVEERSGLDRAALAQRLAGEMPEAIYHRHEALGARVGGAAGQLRRFGLAGLGLAVVATAVIVTLAARASLAINAQVIATLRLIGATDGYITRAFVRRIGLHTFAGATAGTLFGAALLAAMPAASITTLSGLAPTGAAGWLSLALIPFGAAAIAYLATRSAAAALLSKAP